MAQRTSITKMKLTKENIKQEKIFSYNDETVVVKQYLPINDKLGMIQDIMTYAMAESNNNFMNPVKIEVFSMLFFTEYYTNIKFTEKQWENPGDTYDIMQSNGVFDMIISHMSQEEYNSVSNYIDTIIEGYYKYNNSFLGILNAISQDYSQLNFDAEKIAKDLGNPENLTLLKDIMTKLG